LGSALEEGRVADAQQAALMGFLAVAERLDTDPEFLASFAVWEEGARLEDAGEWSAAEVHYRRMLELARERSDKYEESQVCEHLAKLCSILGRNTDAFDHAKAAYAAVRHDDLEMLLAMKLLDVSTYAAKAGNWHEAEAAARQAQELLEERALFDQLRARCLLLLASCKLQSVDPSEVDANLQSAFDLLAPWSTQELAAGIHASLACLYELRAKLADLRGDRQGALDASAAAVAARRKVAAAPQLAGPYAKVNLADTLTKYAARLQLANDQMAASRALAEANQIRAHFKLND
jgi:hypothetical protein